MVEQGTLDLLRTQVSDCELVYIWVFWSQGTIKKAKGQ